MSNIDELHEQMIQEIQERQYKPIIDKPIKKKPRKLTIKQQQFCQVITNPDNKKTYGNQTQSAMLVYNNNNPDTAGVQGSRLLSDVRIRDEIERLMKQKGIGVEDRVHILSTLPTRRRKIYTQYHRDKKGNVDSTYVEAEPSTQEIIKVIDIANRMTATYEKADSIAKLAAKQFAQLLDRHKKKMQKIENVIQSDYDPSQAISKKNDD
jgi:phage terminase small subunit